MDDESRQLARIERHLAADDPVLGQAFGLWHERCCVVTPPADDHVPAWVLVLVLLVLPAWMVVGHYVVILVAGMCVAWLVFALDGDDRSGSPPPGADGPGPRWAPHPSGWWT